MGLALTPVPLSPTTTAPPPVFTTSNPLCNPVVCGEKVTVIGQLGPTSALGHELVLIANAAEPTMKAPETITGVLVPPVMATVARALSLVTGCGPKLTCVGAPKTAGFAVHGSVRSDDATVPYTLR